MPDQPAAAPAPMPRAGGGAIRRRGGPVPWRTAAWRTVLFASLWLILTEGDAGAWLPGLLAAAAAAWASLRLLPPQQAGRVRLPALAGLVLRFLRRSVLAGLDVAWRALSPRMPLDPGFVACPLRLPPGPACNAFTAELSLLPGTLAAGMAGGRLTIHCLDRRQDVAAEAEAEQARLAAALGRAEGEGP
ncbi:Na+/H+ antiporter subunit E [Roseicella aerolata]|uniref:Na+/H+ antiporter subunit E n=1 Tax=Roseicella aerolata TaxID=2883479 RepID=A0A9X1IE00_9PROT|nr:Na+/H+ antiporter subunit E [Roseicella aerolata]MCB4821315.1 Na+/H+ antiporter subunit E [Roseicella aerolata]